MSALEQEEQVIRPRRGLVGIDFREIWIYRELFVFMTLRDVLIRYKQAALGVMWAVVQPLLMMVVFTVIFGRLLGMQEELDVPYPIMTFAALLPWTYFSNAMSNSSLSMVAAGSMLRKIYFPRLIIPVSTTLSGLVDLLISFVILLALMLYYQVAFRLELLLIPLFSLYAVFAALAVGFWFSALNVKYRDIKHIVPFIVRIGLYVSPVVFYSEIIPERWRLWVNLNPMFGIIDGFRWAILGPQYMPYWPGFFVGLAAVTVIFITGLIYFRTAEKSFADIV